MVDLAFHVGDLVGLLVITAVIWTKLDAVKEAFLTHVGDDSKRFDENNDARQRLRDELGAVSNRVAVLEGRAEMQR